MSAAYREPVVGDESPDEGLLSLQHVANESLVQPKPESEWPFGTFIVAELAVVFLSIVFLVTR